MPGPAIIAAVLSCAAPLALDGDTIRCANLERPVRLLGIDAPELPGHCRMGRTCAPGNPWASRAALAGLLRGQPVTVQPLGHDRYGRIIATVALGAGPVRIDASCHQLALGRAVYVARWDQGRRVAMACPAHAIAHAIEGGR